MPSISSLRRRLLLAFLLTVGSLLFLLPTWALHPGIDPNGLENLKDIDPDALSYFARLAHSDSPRRLDVDPLEGFQPDVPSLDRQKGLIATQQGFFDPKDARSLQRLPADMRPLVAHPAPPGKGLGLGSSIGIIQLSEGAIKSRGFDPIQADIQALGVKILETR